MAPKLIHSHLLEGSMMPGKEIAVKIDQTLTQDATGTLVMLELEAMNLDRTKAELSVQYIKVSKNIRASIKIQKSLVTARDQNQPCAYECLIRFNNGRIITDNQ